MLERANVMHNIAATGYAQPLTWITPSRLVSHGILPPTLTSAAVPSTFFDRGLKEFEIPVAADELWQQAWRGIIRAASRRPILTSRSLTHGSVRLISNLSRTAKILIYDRRPGSARGPREALCRGHRR